MSIEQEIFPSYRPIKEKLILVVYVICISLLLLKRLNINAK